MQKIGAFGVVEGEPNAPLVAGGGRQCPWPATGGESGEGPNGEGPNGAREALKPICHQLPLGARETERQKGQKKEKKAVRSQRHARKGKW